MQTRWTRSPIRMKASQQYLSLVKNRGIARGRIELEDLFQPPLSIPNAAGLGVELFGEKGLKEIIQELNESVFRKAI